MCDYVNERSKHNFYMIHILDIFLNSVIIYLMSIRCRKYLADVVIYKELELRKIQVKNELILLDDKLLNLPRGIRYD
jgi:hypothetical protein